MLRGFKPSAFLRSHWQQRPLLVRQAMPGLCSPLSPEELAGLAMEPEIPSRLVIERSEKSWDVRYGPFTEEDFTELPPTNWSLLVTDLEKFVPRLGKLVEPFRFIPDWRIDDLMISYAPPQGSVGPHTDAYDVFLLQIKGHRRWQIDTRPVDANNCLPDTPLRILRDFQADQEWVLEPGDMLYLPPHVAHHGIALDDCMTASIGFRAPSQKDLLGAWLDDRLARMDSERRYSDRGLALQDNPGEITATARERAEILVREALETDSAAFGRWFGCYVTEPRADLTSLYPTPQEWSVESLRAHLAQGAPLFRNPAARLAWSAAEGQLLCFADGEAQELSEAAGPLVENLCLNYEYPASELLRLFSDENAALLVWLLRRGVLETLEDIDHD